MSGPASRRGFLSGLASLPLIGGSVALIGSPSAVAAPLTPDLLDSYDAWLEYERRWLQWERYGNRDTIQRLSLPFRDEMAGWDQFDMIPAANDGARFHGNSEPPASTRAALVLSTVGCGWRGF
ncbi:hypothetical protein [Methylobacterium sp. Leaf106]|uniref:hypothetical protein n=1 Tax=Methylobacterium sp. Leaf106 TaxID=1736255 RepID=UPI0006FFAAE2|nr:hypothetical protein [Methylobacterium sp. Leaf106]KQP53027.1 hypothetical protein ASF34_01250 [Methylobacterium sp. Leaf106]